MINDEIIKIKDSIVNTTPIEKLYLFGSYAYGTPNEDSDYDFFITLPDTGIKPLDAVLQARFALIPLERKIPVDIFADYQSRFDIRSKLNTLERKIANEGVLLYERV